MAAADWNSTRPDLAHFERNNDGWSRVEYADIDRDDPAAAMTIKSDPITEYRRIFVTSKAATQPHCRFVEFRHELGHALGFEHGQHYWVTYPSTEC